MTTETLSMRQGPPAMACAPDAIARPMMAYVDAYAQSGNGSASSPFVGWEKGVLGLTEYHDVLLQFTAGYYRASEQLPLGIGWEVCGSSITRTIIQTAPNYTGPVFVAAAPINASTAGYIRIHDLAIKTENKAGTAIDITGMGGVWLDRVRLTGFKYGLILDQVALCYIDGCTFELLWGVPEQRGIWIVNGPDRVPGAHIQFTNVIHVNRCHFNSDRADAIFIADDGGHAHSIEHCHFNGGGTCWRAAGVSPGYFGRNYCEGQSGPAVLGTYKTLSGQGVGPTFNLTIESNLFSSKREAVKIESVWGLIVQGNAMPGPAAKQIVGLENVGGEVVVQANWPPGTSKATK